MPQAALNGYEATKTIRALGRKDKDLPIIAMTADAFADDVQYCLDCGMNAHVAKPLDIKVLLSFSVVPDVPSAY